MAAILINERKEQSIMAKNATTFTPGRGDADWDGSDPAHDRDLAMIAKDYPKQQLKHFYDDEGKLVEYKRGYPVFYLSGDGQTWCYNCANDQEAEPPIIAGQTNGDDQYPETKLCNGCGRQIHPIHIVRQNANARYIYNTQTLTVLCIAYETPVAMFLHDSYTVYHTDINWSASLSKQLSRFHCEMWHAKAARLGADSKYDVAFPKYDTCPQEQLDEILEKWTGRARLAETRSPHENYHQGVAYRVNTAKWIGEYAELRKELASRKNYRLVITDKV